ncbi:SDR family oxidoreductase, partial [bacterium]|nr:SDR family oxidoreductase [bacterium]
MTAADAGLGAGIARALAAAGARLAINHAGAAAATERLVGEIAAAGGQAFGVEADLGSEAEVRAMFAQVSDTFGGLDILVNTAAMRDICAAAFFAD